MKVLSLMCGVAAMMLVNTGSFAAKGQALPWCDETDQHWRDMGMCHKRSTGNSAKAEAKAEANSNSKVMNSGNSSNRNTNVAKGGSARSNQKQGQGQEQGQEVYIEGDTDNSVVNYEAEDHPANSVFAPALVAQDCMGSTTGGLQTKVFGIALGSTKINDRCQRLNDARFIHNTDDSSMVPFAIIGCRYQDEVSNAGKGYELEACGKTYVPSNMGTVVTPQKSPEVFYGDDEVPGMGK